MGMEERKSFFETVSVGGNLELDYLTSAISEMGLITVDVYTVTNATANRPDIISNLYYGSYDFGWLLHSHNNIMNPIEDYYTGREIKIPSLDDYYRFYNRNSVQV
ncbi:MAG: hypothetical protein PF440_04125 [Thiomicrorhabdus sp.]|jgi:hypothetical protein|nr:hypothetical protein [Thiomicrorhabdus sp.]